MDSSDLIIEYSDADFARVIRQLLPKGHYWQDGDNAKLSNLIAGMGAEFKVTHDEIQLTLLAEIENTLFGWRLDDYRNLMIEYGIVGEVCDNPLTPNIILIALDPSQNYANMMMAFDEARLPHTKFHWIFNVMANVDNPMAYIGGYQKSVYQIRIGGANARH